MSTYQNLVAEIEQKVSENNRRDAILLKLPGALMAKFVEVMEMPPEMCQVGEPTAGGFSLDLHPEGGKLDFSVAVMIPGTLGVPPFLIPISAFARGNCYHAAVSNYAPVSIAFAPALDDVHLIVLAHHTAEFFRNSVREFLK